MCQEGGYLEDVEGSWPDPWRTLSFLMSWMMFFYPKFFYPWKFCVDISIISVSGRGGQEGWYLEDIEGSWPETWRTRLFLTSWMMFFTPRKIPWKFHVYLYGKCVFTWLLYDLVKKRWTLYFGYMYIYTYFDSLVFRGANRQI